MHEPQYLGLQYFWCYSLSSKVFFSLKSSSFFAVPICLSARRFFVSRAAKYAEVRVSSNAGPFLKNYMWRKYPNGLSKRYKNPLTGFRSYLKYPQIWYIRYVTSATRLKNLVIHLIACVMKYWPGLWSWKVRAVVVSLGWLSLGELSGRPERILFQDNQTFTHFILLPLSRFWNRPSV